MGGEHLTGGFGDAFGAVLFKKITASTMDDARDAVAQGACHGTVCMAETQSKGRGRIEGRSWVDDGKSLLCTIILEKSKAATPYPPTQLMAFCLCRYLEKSLRLPAGIKWPNDVLVPMGRAGSYAGSTQLPPVTSPYDSASSGRKSIDSAGAGLNLDPDNLRVVKGKIDGSTGAGLNTAAYSESVPNGKIAGILVESFGGFFLCGMGVNISQSQFPENLRRPAVSIAMALEAFGEVNAGGAEAGNSLYAGRLSEAGNSLGALESGKPLAAGSPLDAGRPFDGGQSLNVPPCPSARDVLNGFLKELSGALGAPPPVGEIERRLLGRGEPVSMLIGDPAKNEVLSGTILGLYEDGALKLQDDSGIIHRIYSGEQVSKSSG